MKNTVRLRASALIVVLVIAVLVIGARPLWSQKDSAVAPQNKSSDIKRDLASPPASYPAGSIVKQPEITHAIPAVYPAETSPDSLPGSCTLSMVIDENGKPKDIFIVRTLGKRYDAAAIQAVQQSTFAAGLVDNKPAPLPIAVRVSFATADIPAMPVILSEPWNAHGGQKIYDKPPKLIFAPEAEYSKQARAAKLNGSVVVQLEVSEKGLPTELRIVRSLGSGLDEKALEAVQQYRFKPAMKDGKPVSVRMTVEVKFNLY